MSAFFFRFKANYSRKMCAYLSLPLQFFHVILIWWKNLFTQQALLIKTLSPGYLLILCFWTKLRLTSLDYYRMMGQQETLWLLFWMLKSNPQMYITFYGTHEVLLIYFFEVIISDCISLQDLPPFSCLLVQYKKKERQENCLVLLQVHILVELQAKIKTTPVECEVRGGNGKLRI